MESDPGAANAANAEQLPPWDEKAALEAAGGDADLARELMATLLDAIPAELASLRDCHEAEDWHRLAQTAHRLRGATSYCGVPALNAVLRDLESASSTADPELIARLLKKVNREAARLRASVSP
jgi:two-component system sensor histidine kinase BarA